MKFLSLTLILLINLVFTSGQLDENEIEYFMCEQQTTCDTCLNENSTCNWCSDESYHLSPQFVLACSSVERLIQFKCPPQSIISSKPPKIEIISNKVFSDIVDKENMEAVQIKPQQISITFSPFETQSFSFKYRPAKEYPLDMYFLMDLTWSMKDDKETMVNLQDNIGKELKNITENFRLAFGSFADKPLMPYTSMEERRRENPCVVEQNTCEMTYDFRHRLSFTDVKQFINAVNSSQVTGNLDNAEGGMDALMQILVCGDRIGWSPKSRKIVIIATDGLSHFAGDGLLGGTVKPNDKECHLSENGYYEKAENMDYPSLEQIYRVLREQKVSVIFAATEEITSYYEQIKNLLPENTFVGRLESDSSNILTLIKRGYEYITSVVDFEMPIDDDIEFTMYSNCGDASRPLIQTSKCKNVKLGESYEFVVNMTAKTNQRKDIMKNKKTILIRETQLGQELLTLDINMATSCNCNDRESESQCPINSYKRCGKCVCHPEWSGRDCTCNENENSNFKNTEGCRPSNNIGPICSGKGDCFCDECQCDQGWTGKFCECKTCQVDPNTNQVCGGKNRGNCVCGVCACRRGWSGPTCSCSDTLCTSPWNNDLCSGNGVCNCEKCKCTERDGKNYTGRYCETCSNCNNPACSLYEKCVLNELKLQVSAKEPCISRDGTIFIPKIELASFPEFSNDQQCIIRIDDEKSQDYGCQYIFTYNVRKDWNTELYIYPKSCPSQFKAANILSLGIIIAIAIVILGAIMWKIYDNISYKAEYRRFLAQKEDEMKMGYLTGNPLYVSPITHFRVPENYNREIN